ncbi:DUF5706 domain-containing protein [Aquibacillus sp. 3ASR75-11]|uniref:DUF5706 domain-containing protein n=1 Tax=Terrihalobacillus insolitus TaxID=2950438 RepID=A0A9X4AN80_9BACI|nr:Pycsar system effector family protein [Terrihalobacillus insolitus]MDC3424255.1 DUF5706 domain-containing protein [Terrihalobacillus insolitus]
MNKETKGYNQEEIGKTLERINYWISNCDTKISFALAFSGVLLGVFFTSNTIQNSLVALFEQFSELDMYNIVVLLTTLIFVAFVICLTLSIWHFFMGLKGSVDSTVFDQDDLQTNSLLYFGTIQALKYTEFKKEVQNITKDELGNDYLSQIHINSVICQTKFNNYKKGIIYLTAAIILFVLLNIGFLFI